MAKTYPLYSPEGQRRYLTVPERDKLLDAAYDSPPNHRTLCLVLAHTGCQLTEALNLTAAHIDLPAGAIFLGTKNVNWRGIPVPCEHLHTIDVIHGIKRAQQGPIKARSAKLWPIDRTGASRWINQIFKQAKLTGLAASMRGLRYGFAVQCVHDGVPLDTLQTWMGYTTKDMTNIFSCVLPIKD